MSNTVRHAIAVLMVIGIALTAAPATPAAAQSGERCFNETGFCISGRIREFWEQNGGLPVFGFPIAPQQVETIEGKSLEVQQFERNRLELHPNNPRPYDVLLGRLGADRLAQQGRDWQAVFPKSDAQAGCRFFSETGHNVCGNILTAWRASGLETDGRRGLSESENLALFGLPLSDIVTETLSDGKQYQVQWFERARFELHPENQPPYNVLLGLLGNELRAGATTPAPTPPASGGETPLPASINAIAVPERGPAGTFFEFVARGFRPGEKVGVYATTPRGLVDGAPFQVIADGDGLVGSSYRTDASDEGGIWAMTYEGTESGNRAVAYFEVQAAPGQAPAPPSALPPAQNAVAVPERGPIGTVFEFAAGGFRPGEKVGVYITAPDRSVAGAPFQVEADGDGIAFAAFFSEVLRGMPGMTGVWAITFEGVDSGNKGIAYFEVIQ